MPRDSGSISLLGLGARGTSVAHQMLQTDNKLCFWNRTSGKTGVKELIDKGAVFSSSVTEILESSRIVMSCLLDYPTVVYRVLQDVNNRRCLHGKTIVNLTNGTPKDARDMLEHLKFEWSVGTYFDGGIMATPPLIGSESSFIFCSGGNEDEFEKDIDGHSVKRVLSLLGRVEYLGASVDSTSLYDLALLAGMYGMYGMLGGAMTAMSLLSKRDGATLPSISTSVSRYLIPWLQAFLPNLETTAKSIEENDVSAGGHGIEMRCIAMKNVTRACEEEGADAGSIQYFLKTYEQVIEEGSGQQGVAAVGRKFWK